jgi:preprotein translocase subunit SecE
LPAARFSVPLILSLLSFWLAYRVVNYPTFADFLIATEAELNKVSWTTRKRLIQDTIVVLVTVILLTVFLFVVDQIWAYTLTKVGVLQIAPASGGPGGAKVPF